MKHILLPKGIDWDDERFSNIDINKAKLVISLLYIITLLKHNNSEEEDWTIPVSRQKWRKLVGDEYLDILQVLIDMKIMGRGTHYKVSTEKERGECKKHWLEEHYRTCPNVVVPIEESYYKTFRQFDYENFLASYQVIRKDCGIPFSIYDNLRKCVQKRLSIEISDDELAELRKKEVPRGNKIQRLGTSDENFITMVKQKIPCCCSIGEDGYRFFSGITQVFRFVRPYLMGDGEHLYEIDITSSQPVFLYLLALKEMGDSADLKKWKEQLENGTLYDDWMSALGYTDRGLFKSQVLFETLYGPNLLKDRWYKKLNKETGIKEWVKKDSGLFTLIRTTYPTIWAFMMKIKNNYSLQKSQYRLLVLACQRAESQFMLGSVIKNLYQNRRNICLFSIHDSIICKKGDLQCVLDMMITEFGKLGILPMLKINDYSVKDGKNSPINIIYRNTHIQSNMTLSLK